MVRWPTVVTSGQGSTVPAPARPLSSTAAAVMILNVEPGS
jgi:hypothetical protein